MRSMLVAALLYGFCLGAISVSEMLPLNLQGFECIPVVCSYIYMIEFSAVRLRGAMHTFLCCSLCSVVCCWPYPTTSAAKAVIPLSSGRHFHTWQCCSFMCIFHCLFLFDHLILGHLSNLSYSLSWRTEHQKSPLWRSRTLCQRSCTTLWYKSLLSCLLNVYFLLSFYVTMWVIMAFIFVWSHCRKKSFIQIWSCVPSWLWLLLPSVPAQCSSPFKSVQAGLCSCNTFLRGVQWGERIFIFFYNDFFFLSFPHSTARS